MATVCVLIKALNEERRIKACLRAAVDEALPLGGEVILVDSLSTDRTVELARAFPVRIVQFESRADCGCAAAVQLGYQFSDAEFVYVLDADMVLQPGFLAEALARLQADASLAGVSGRVLDVAINTGSDARRAAAARAQVANAFVKELGGGGMYRVSALRKTGYLAHRGLAAFEEAELGARLVSDGWRLLRLARPAVMHEGHVETNWQMLSRLWRNRRAHATGAVLRSALGRPWFWVLARKQAYIAVIPAVWMLSLVVASVFRLDQSGFFAVLLLLISSLTALLAIRKRGVGPALWTLVFWHYFSVAALLGFLPPVIDPMRPIAGREVATPSNSNAAKEAIC